MNQIFQNAKIDMLDLSNAFKLMGVGMNQIFQNANIDMLDLSNAFKLMGVGMLGIFVVMVVISLIVFISTKIPSKKN